MSYHFSTRVEMPFGAAIAATKEALGRHGFGVLTEIDVQQTLKNKLGVEFRPYVILGACNPKMAHQALQAEDKIGTMLPCNVILQQHADGRTEVSAVDPVASMQAIDNPELAAIARQVRAMLQDVVGSLRSGTGGHPPPS